MTDALRDNTLIVREFQKFGTAEAKQSKQDWKAAESLYKTVDGYGLRSFTKEVGMSKWISAAVPKFPSRQYIRCRNATHSVKCTPSVCEGLQLTLRDCWKMLAHLYATEEE